MFSTIATDKISRKIDAYKVFRILYLIFFYFAMVYNYSSFTTEKQHFLLYSVEYEVDQLGDVSSPFR